MSVVRVAQFLVDVICAWQRCAEKKQKLTVGDAATPAAGRTLVTADETVVGEVELADFTTVERSLGFERPLFFHLESVLRLHAECGSRVSLGLMFEGQGRLVGFVLCSHWASVHKVRI